MEIHVGTTEVEYVDAKASGVFCFAFILAIYQISKWSLNDTGWDHPHQGSAQARASLTAQRVRKKQK